ncbi:hypothetical protein BD779DRAFT_1484306, partial [Infundibulicybe gibba]
MRMKKALILYITAKCHCRTCVLLGLHDVSGTDKLIYFGRIGLGRHSQGWGQDRAALGERPPLMLMACLTPMTKSYQPRFSVQPGKM